MTDQMQYKLRIFDNKFALLSSSYYFTNFQSISSFKSLRNSTLTKLRDPERILFLTESLSE